MTKTSAPREIYATEISFDASTGEIKYTLPEPALVRLRIGIRDGGPLLRTLLDWEERGAGSFVERWDGMDATGKISLIGRNDLMLVLMCILKDSRDRDAALKGYRTAPGFNISFPENNMKNPDGIPLVKDTISVRVILDPEDRQWLTQAKYELGMYIDQVFLMEDEEGTNPFTYKLDTKMMNNGVHSITVNLAVYDGEIGTESVLVDVENK